jgi:hypothetical protein
MTSGASTRRFSSRNLDRYPSSLWSYRFFNHQGAPALDLGETKSLTNLNLGRLENELVRKRLIAGSSSSARFVSNPLLRSQFHHLRIAKTHTTRL